MWVHGLSRETSNQNEYREINERERLSFFFCLFFFYKVFGLRFRVVGIR